MSLCTVCVWQEKMVVGWTMFGILMAPNMWFFYNLNYYRSYPGPLREFGDPDVLRR